MESPHRARSRSLGIAVAPERFVSVNGPPLDHLPGWALLRRTETCEFHLHPPIAYEVHYRVDMYVLIFAYSGGTARVAEGDGPLVERAFTAGSLRLIPPGVRIRSIQTRPLEFAAVGIAPARFRAVADRSARDWCPDALVGLRDAAIEALFSELRRSLLADGAVAGPYLDALADALVARLASGPLRAERGDAATERLTPAMQRRLIAAIDDRLDDGITVAALAEMAGLSRSHFSRAFRQGLGEAPARFIQRRRIGRARMMLSETDRSLTEIAGACGYANPSHFTTTFRREMGLTPSAYRRAIAGRGAP